MMTNQQREEIKARRARLGYIETMPMVSIDVINRRVEAKMAETLAAIDKRTRRLISEVEKEKKEAERLARILAETKKQEQRRITTKQIINIVSNHFNVQPREIVGHRRFGSIIIPRHIVYWAAREFTDLSFPVIAKHLGNRDHTTILHGSEKINRLIKSGHPIADDCQAISNLILELKNSHPAGQE
jgi:chromosomal replication initiator protein